ncbi:MAG: hypothetical protein P1P83_12415 [Bacteroidales bacterium]|nr:hypothetical protein [Bacteroidales bacterium]MDT8374732.1 hypothetical protein [Bacteroidales bacterium]
MRTKLTLVLLAISMTTLLAQPDQRIAKTPKVNYDWRPGYVYITELTGAIGLGDTESELSKYYYGITALAGYQFSRNIKVGAGVGVHSHEEGALFPIFIDMRLSLNAQDVVPFLAGAGGIMLDFTNLNDTRIFINPSVGIKYVAANRTGVSFSTGLMVTTGGPQARKSFINFKLGLELKGKQNP